jgi:hypothetical protein
MSTPEDPKTPTDQPASPESQGELPTPHENGWAIAAMILWIVGFACSGLGANELLTALRCGNAPRSIDCARLASSGPPETVFITLTSFKPNWDGYALYQDEHGRWINADVPLVADGETTPRVIAHVAQPLNAQNLQKMLSGPELTGLVTGRGAGDSSAILASQNPGMDPGSCWVVELGGHPFDKKLMSLVFVGGLALFAASIWMLVEKYRPGKPRQSTLEIMSPLLMFFNGLHALGRRLPCSRCTRGAVLLPLAIAVMTYGACLFVRLIAPQTVTQLGTFLLCIIALQIGASLLAVACSFLLIEGDIAAK